MFGLKKIKISLQLEDYFSILFYFLVVIHKFLRKCFNITFLFPKLKMLFENLWLVSSTSCCLGIGIFFISVQNAFEDQIQMPQGSKMFKMKDMNRLMIGVASQEINMPQWFEFRKKKSPFTHLIESSLLPPTPSEQTAKL